MKEKIIVLDTEALGLLKPIVYEVGYVIADTDGKVICKRDYLIKQVYDNEELFATAYFANKRDVYNKKIADGLAKLVYWGYAMKVLASDIEKYGITKIYAYNSRFDKGAINYTHEIYPAKCKPTADGIEDIMRYIKPIISTAEYKEFCEANGYMTANNRHQKTAEVVYRYLTNNVDFIEDHMAVEDCLIELEILLKSLERALGD